MLWGSAHRSERHGDGYNALCVYVHVCLFECKCTRKRCSVRSCVGVEALVFSTCTSLVCRCDDGCCSDRMHKTSALYSAVGCR